MKHTKKVIALLLVALMTVFSFTACTDKGSNTGNTDTSGAQTLKVWAPQEEQEILVDMCNSFLEAHPDYNVKFEYAIMGVDASIDAIKKDADSAADVFLYPSGGISELTDAGLLCPITFGTEELAATHTEQSIEGCSKDGTIYGVPVTPNTYFMYYNKSMYTEDEVKSLETMMAKDLGDGIKNFSCTLSDSWYLSAWFFGAGCTLFGEDGTDANSCTFNNEDGYKLGLYLLDLVNNDKYLEDAEGLAGDKMAAGELGALCSGTWSAATLKEQLGDNFGAAKLPTIQIDGKECQLSSFIDYKCYGVNAMTKNPQIAIELAQWLGNEQCQMMRFETNADAPTVKSLLDVPSVAEREEISALLTQEPFCTQQPTVAKLSDFWTPCTAFGQELVNGTLTEANLQSKLDAMVDGILSDLV
ncbi:MAG: extracellular solute-binding protein [Ruminococcus sp.]